VNRRNPTMDRHLLSIYCRAASEPRWFARLLLAAALTLHNSATVTAQTSATGVCHSLTPAAVGGPHPPDSVITLRWMGTANYELAHRNTVVLLDAYYDRGPRNRPIGTTPNSITRATVIFVGHAHFDHISDAATVARKTGAKVVGAASAIEVVRRLGVPANQTLTVTGRGGELLRFDGFTVEPVLAHHSVLSRPVLAKFREALAVAVQTGPSIP
jgi:beta-lactamase family protein